METTAIGPLRTLRKARGLSLEELAQRSGVSIGALSRIERGERQPRAETLAKIASALGLTELVELLEPWRSR